MNKKPLLIGCSVAMVIGVGLLACGAYLAYRALRQASVDTSQIPAELKQPGVLGGDGLLSKEVFSTDYRLAQVEAMTFGSVESGAADELCSVSGYGALFLDSDGATKRYIPYDIQQIKVLGMKLQAAGSRLSRFQIIDLGGAGECSFLARDNVMGSELIGHNGKSVWKLGTGMDIESHPADMVAGDLYDDGKTEFVAAYSFGEKGLVLYDASLNELWSKPDIRASHVELMDADNGKKNIACCESDYVMLLDSQGSLVRKFQVQSYLRDFLVLTWPPGSAAQFVLCRNDDDVDLYDNNGKLVFKCELPAGKHIYRLRAVAFMVGKIPYLAIVGSGAFGEHRSIFCVYGLPERPLRNQIVHQSPIYHEILGESYEAITTLPPDDSGRVSILIGGPAQILRYRPRSLPGDVPKQRR